MYLILKGQPPKPICRECRKLHAPKDCPQRKRRTLEESVELAIRIERGEADPGERVSPRIREIVRGVLARKGMRSA